MVFLQIFPQSNDWIIGISGNQTWLDNPRKETEVEIEGKSSIDGGFSIDYWLVYSRYWLVVWNIIYNYIFFPYIYIYIWNNHPN